MVETVRVPVLQAPEDAFDLGDKSGSAELAGLTALAADICGCIAAFVIVQGPDGGSIVSSYGIEPSLIPSDGSMSARPRPGDALDLVIDMVADERFAGHPLVVGEPYARFFAAVPLEAANGRRFGSLCVLDPAPHRLSNIQRRGLLTLEKQIELHFELARQRVYARLHAEHQRAQAIDQRDRAVDERDRFFDLSLDPMCIVNADGYFSRVNHAFYAMLGFDRDVEMTGLRSIDFVHPEDRERALTSAKALRERPGTPNRTEARYRHRDGSYRWVSWTAIADPDVHQIFAIARDETDSRRIEAERRHAQKMELLGRVAGGVVHDFNNLLSIIMAASATVAESLPEGNPAREELTSILEASENAATLTRQLLSFARKRHETKLQLVDVSTVALGVERLVKRTLGEKIELTVAVPDERWVINGEASQLQQVLMNLVLNARDALPNGGAIGIAIAHVTRGSDKLVRLTVRDNGHGMDEATRSRIFEPFFTTKPPERGTGLGLATVFEIVSRHKATINVESAVGVGTTFVIEFRKA